MIKKTVIFIILVIFFLFIMRKPGNKNEISNSQKDILISKKSALKEISSNESSLKFSHIRNIFEIPQEFRKKNDINIPENISNDNNSLHLDGVFLGKKRFAIINGNVYSLEDKILGQKIISIDMKSVKFSNGNTLKFDQ